jgi:hypothetical protein
LLAGGGEDVGGGAGLTAGRIQPDTRAGAQRQFLCGTVFKLQDFTVVGERIEFLGLWREAAHDDIGLGDGRTGEERSPFPFTLLGNFEEGPFTFSRL